MPRHESGRGRGSGAAVRPSGRGARSSAKPVGNNNNNNNNLFRRGGAQPDDTCARDDAERLENEAASAVDDGAFQEAADK